MSYSGDLRSFLVIFQISTTVDGDRRRVFQHGTVVPFEVSGGVQPKIRNYKERKSITKG